jgi:hypothetical protein
MRRIVEALYAGKAEQYIETVVKFEGRPYGSVSATPYQYQNLFPGRRSLNKTMTKKKTGDVILTSTTSACVLRRQGADRIFHVEGA